MMMDKNNAEAFIQKLGEKLNPIFERYKIQKAILFGSHARQEATRHSDLDLILVQETDKRFFDRYDGLLRDLNLALETGAVEILIYTPLELQAISHRPFIAKALKEGKVLYECE